MGAGHDGAARELARRLGAHADAAGYLRTDEAGRPRLLHRLLPGDELLEYICQENQRDTQHLVGPAGRP